VLDSLGDLGLRFSDPAEYRRLQAWGEARVRIFAPVVDAATGAPILLVQDKSISSDFMPQRTDKELMECVVRGWLMRFELHEMDEWLRLDGVCVREPHPELSKAAPEKPGKKAAAHDLCPTCGADVNYGQPCICSPTYNSC
jgi:hypothetical protein